MAKKPFKTLSATALTAAFMTSAVVPVAAAETPVEAAATSVTHYVVDIDGSAVQVTVAEFGDLRAAGIVAMEDVIYLKAGDVVYTVATYQDAKAALIASGDTSDQGSVLAFLTEEGVSSEEVDVYEPTRDEDGTIVIEDGGITAGELVGNPAEAALAEAKAAVDALPAVDAVKVEDKEAVAAAKALVADAKELGADVASLEATIASLEAKIAELEVGTTAVASTTATGAKVITVKFNKAVDNTKATFEIKKGTSTLSVAKTTWNEAKTEVQLELNSKLTEGTYNVSVKGLTEAALTGSVTAENEKVSEIKILSENLVITGDKTATVGYQVVNQYGEDVTAVAALAGNLQITSSVGTADDDNKGKITVTTTGTDFKAADKVALTIIDPASAKTANATLTLASKAQVSEVTLGDIYNKDGKVLSEDTKAEPFYILLNAKDQYGNAVTDAAKANDELTVLSSNQVVNKISTEGAAIEKLTINNKDQLAVKLEPQAAGSSLVSVIANANGSVTSKTVTVAEGTKVDTVVIGTPEGTLTGNKTVLIPVEVTDNKGTVITKVADLKGLTPTVTGGTASSFVEKDGKLYIQTTTAAVTSNNVGNLIVTVTTPTNKVANKVFQVQPNAVATTLVGLKSTVPTAILAGETLTLKQSDFIVEDQYGNKLDSGYTVTAETNDATKVAVSGLALTALKETATITFKINAGSTTTPKESSFETVYSTVKLSDISSYKVEDLGTLYADAAKQELYAKELKVYGVASSGKEVLIPSSEYNVTSLNGLSYSGGKLYGESSKVDNDTTTTKPDTYNASAKVIINDTGAEVNVEAKISSVEPKATTFEVRQGGTKEGTVLSSITATGDVNLNAADFANSLYVVDQYGTKFSAPVKLTFTNLVDADKDNSAAIAGNGTTAANIAGIEAGDTVTAKITVGTLSQTVSVTVGAVGGAAVTSLETGTETKINTTTSAAIASTPATAGITVAVESNATDAAKDEIKVATNGNTTATVENLLATVITELPAEVTVINGVDVTTLKTKSEAEILEQASAVLGVELPANLKVSDLAGQTFEIPATLKDGNVSLEKLYTLTF